MSRQFENTDTQILIEVAKSLQNRRTIARQLAVESQESTQARLVWFVAISGFGFLNLGDFVMVIRGHEISGIGLALMVLPWVIAGICGIVAHMKAGDMAVVDARAYNDESGYVETFTLPRLGNEGFDLESELERLLRDEHLPDEIRELKDKSLKMVVVANRWERATYYFLILSLVWSLAGVYLLNWLGIA